MSYLNGLIKKQLKQILHLQKLQEKIMCQIAEREGKIRDLINHPWKQNSLIKNTVKWNKICASLDVIGDTQTAISDFQNLPEFTSKSGGYLFIYGLLQALFLQQDAINSIYESLFDNKIDWAKDFPDIYQIRELRSDSIGHPTNRKNDKSFHFISFQSISNVSFDLMSHISENGELIFRSIEISELIEKQQKNVIDILDDIICRMEHDYEKHKSKFRNNKIADLIKGIHYSASKISEGIYRSYPLTTSNLKTLESKINSIKEEVVKRYGSLDALDGLYETIMRIDYILEKLGNWIKNNELHENKDAEIFMDSFFVRFGELKKELEEIDREFS